MSEVGEIKIISASDPELNVVRSLWRDYWEWLGLPHDFQDFAEELTTLPGAYAPPPGRLLLASLRCEAAGTGALRPLAQHRCEVKRLYVARRFRGKGIGKLLLQRLIDEARVAGYQEMYGDTLKSMAAALQMYRQMGFSEVGPYSADPTPKAIFIRLVL
jgi:GNAT superfamily N-acetyltransferase